MPTYGQRPQDTVTDSRGNTLRGVTVKLYASQPEALADGTPAGTSTTDARGRWSYSSDGEVWARVGTEVWEVAPAPTVVDTAESLTVVASGATVNTAAGDTDGQLQGYWVKSGTAVINGATCLPGVHIFAWDADTSEWGIATIGSVDTTAPTAGVLSVTDYDTSSISVSVAGALDETELHATPYSFRIDSGAWSAWQAGATYDYTGLTDDTSYDVQHRVRDAAGNITEGAAVTQSTTPLISWAALATWDFTAADNTELNGLAPSSGSGVALTSAMATDLGLSPPRSVNVQSNKAFFKWSGTSIGPITFTCTSGNALGIAVDFDFDATSSTSFTAPGRITVGTNSAGTNQVGFNIAANGTITSYHNAAGSTSYTAEPGAPTVVPDTCNIRAEFTPGGGGGCTGELYIDGVLYGTITSSGWTWQGKHILMWPINNQQPYLYWDNLSIEALS